MTKSSRKRPKTSQKTDNKEEEVRVRCTAEEKRELQAAAQKEDLKTATWLRRVGLKAARSELGGA